MVPSNRMVGNSVYLTWQHPLPAFWQPSSAAPGLLARVLSSAASLPLRPSPSAGILDTCSFSLAGLLLFLLPELLFYLYLLLGLLVFAVSHSGTAQKPPTSWLYIPATLRDTLPCMQRCHCIHNCLHARSKQPEQVSKKVSMFWKRHILSVQRMLMIVTQSDLINST